MKLKSISLENVRNYEKLRFDFPDEKIIIIQGPNAQGKTNFLESILLLSLTKSFAAAKQEELIMWEKDFARIEGTIIDQEDSLELELFWGKTKQFPKTTKVNNVKKKTEDFVGTLQSVIFTPKEMNLISDSPSIRRRYLNIILSQTDKSYLRSLSKYQNILKNRNALLKMIGANRAKEDELTFWDTKLVEEGSNIYFKRRKLIKEIQKTLSDNYSHIAGKKNSLKIIWSKEIPESLEKINSFYQKKIKAMRPKDIATETTLSGPHRDDFSILLNEKEISISGSRGEWRSAVLALKLSEVDYIKKSTKKTPILLLDDVLSEFDSERQKNVLSLFHTDQIIITTTHLLNQPEHSRVYEVKQGTIN
jgi:DNA replication and repair protein RecF